MKIAFIGGGNMGEAIISAILERNLIVSKFITVSDSNESCRKHLKRKYGISTINDNLIAAKQGDAVVLAIKPQNLKVVMAELNGQLKTSQLVLSILAGIRISTLCSGLDHERVIRVMPNTPAQIGEGVSIWTATAAISKQQKRWVGSILSAMGTEIYVDDEKYIDMATAVSGSGPAYFFMFVEALIEASRNIGLANDIAQELVLETMMGSVCFLRKSGRSPLELRRMVTSPGGTTAEAVDVFERGGLKALVNKAVMAAYNKAERLDKYMA